MRSSHSYTWFTSFRTPDLSSPSAILSSLALISFQIALYPEVADVAVFHQSQLHPEAKTLVGVIGLARPASAVPRDLALGDVVSQFPRPPALDRPCPAGFPHQENPHDAGGGKQAPPERIEPVPAEDAIEAM